MYHFNEYSKIRSRINTIDFLLENFKRFLNMIKYAAVSTLNFYIEVTFWLRKLYINRLKFSKVSKKNISFQIFSRAVSMFSQRSSKISRKPSFQINQSPSSN